MTAKPATHTCKLAAQADACEGAQVTGKASDASAAAQDTASDAAGRAQKVAGDTYDAAKGSAYDATASGRLAAKDAAAQAGSTWEKAKNVVSDVVDKVRLAKRLVEEQSCGCCMHCLQPEHAWLYV